MNEASSMSTAELGRHKLVEDSAIASVIGNRRYNDDARLVGVRILSEPELKCDHKSQGLERRNNKTGTISFFKYPRKILLGDLKGKPGGPPCAYSTIFIKRGKPSTYACAGVTSLGINSGSALSCEIFVPHS